MIRSLLSVRTLTILGVAAITIASGDVVLAADGAAAGHSLIDLTKYFGAGLTVIGAAFGIGKLAASAYESMARQPEVAGSINTAMIIAAALIEGFTFFALYICYAA